MSKTELSVAKDVDFVVRGDGRAARVISIAWTEIDGEKKMPVQRGMRPATREEVALWRALSAALRLQVQ